MKVYFSYCENKSKKEIIKEFELLKSYFPGSEIGTGDLTNCNGVYIKNSDVFVFSSSYGLVTLRGFNEICAAEAFSKPVYYINGNTIKKIRKTNLRMTGKTKPGFYGAVKPDVSAFKPVFPTGKPKARRQF